MRPRPRKPWTLRDASLLALMLGVGAWVMRAPLQDIFTVAWRDEEQSHILLAPLVALWLMWLRRSRLSLIKVQPSLIGPATVAIGIVTSWFGFHSDTYIAWHAGALLVLLGMLLSMTGWEAIRQFAPALLALAFLLPVPSTVRQTVALPLQSLATTVTHTCLETFGTHAARSGNVLIINGEQVAVNEACNGLRLVFSLTLIVYAFAFSTLLRPTTRIMLIALSPVIALLANVVRLVPTSLLYGHASAEQAQAFHDLAGWIMLPLVLVGLVAVLRFCRWLELPVTTYRFAYP